MNANEGWTTREGRARGGSRFSKTTLHNMLTNVTYTGNVKFEGKLCEGEHQRIVDDDTFNRVQEQLQPQRRKGGRSVRNKAQRVAERAWFGVAVAAVR